MREDQLKLLSLIVGGGSGMLFQPMTNEYTYVFTAKHIFLDKITTEGRPDSYKEKVNGSIVLIYQLTLNEDLWNSNLIEFEVKKGENYFPHQTADIALLKIKFMEGFAQTHILENCSINNDYYLCGFPNDKRGANNGNFPNQYTNYQISHKIASINNLIEVRLSQPKTQPEILGMSGGGIFRITNDSIDIIGIQSQMAKTISLQNEIDFVPITLFNP